ncbi:MAG: hypothetical protein GY758_21555, partial [Fuerstiella sp.]|nr:hypothetical protein [Fuerstiella sp.]
TAAAPEAGDWGGIYIGHTGSISVDQALITHAGGVIPLESDFAGFNPIEIHQAKGRIRNTVFENNAGGLGGTAPGNRFDLLPHSTGTIFVRGAQPVIIDNIFRDNSGPVININTNALNSDIVTDPGRSTGAVDRQAGYIDNQGPLVRDNTLGRNEINGMLVRGETLTTQSVWDDTDMVHVLQNEVYIPDLHTSGGLRLESSPAESLVIKLSGANSGFSASGEPLDIVDRIGGMLHVVGQPGQPVVMTSIADDTVGAGFDLDGFPLTDTNNDGNVTDPTDAANRWRGISIEEYAHDRNIGVYVENEVADAAIADSNATTAEVVGTIAADQKSGDETLRLGFEIHGTIDNPGDVDVYSISAEAGSQIWIDIDQSTQALDTVVELLDASGQVLALSDNTLDEDEQDGSWSVVANNGTQAFTLDYSQYNSDDLFTLNQRDAGMRVLLPGTVGTRTDYLIRVRSSNIDSTDGAASRTDLEDPTLVGNGLTQGAYQLQVRLQELDEFPGTTVQFADIRYAATGIDITGLPIHSPLTGESEEVEGTDTDLGNLMDTDRAVLAVRGNIVDPADIDFYKFEVNYESTQQIDGVALVGPHVPVTFDLDYSDGFGRGDLTMAVYDSGGSLILIGRDSNIADDRHHSPDDSPLLSDLTRGTVGAFDPFIGSVELPGGNYTLAVTNNRLLPSGLDQFFNSGSSSAALRVEPINSVERIAEERFSGPTDTFTSASAPTTDLFTVSDLGELDPSHVVPFNLADVVLFVSSGFGINGSNQTSVRTVNPFTGYQDTVLGQFGPSIGDIAMRPDGQLYTMTTGPQGGGASNAGNTGNYLEIDTGTAAVNNIGDDGITANLSNNGAPPDAVAYANAHFVFDAMMFSGTGGSDRFAIGTRVDPLALPNNTSKVNQYDENVLFNFLSQGSAVDGAGGDRTGFARAFLGAGTTQREIGQVNTIGDANVTGMARLNDGSGDTYIVDENGMLYTLNLFTATATFVVDLGVPNAAGLAAGPDDVEDSAFASMLFTIDATGELFAFDTMGVPQPIFVDAQTSVDTGTFAVNGLAFGTLERNLWGLTGHRGTDAGHGVETRFDDSALATREEGGTTLYFGNTIGGPNAGNQNNLANGTINDVNFPGGAHGSAVSNQFSLVGYDKDDKPALYFNYFLETENAEYDYGPNPDDLMRDSFRVFVGDESGEWNLVSTNDGLQLSDFPDEFDYGPDGTATMAPVTQNFPDVVETFDTAEWRQARVDLSNYAGRDNLRLRFDFSTAGSMDIGNLNTRGFELYALSADKLSDGDTFVVDTMTFEFELGRHMTVPSGAAALGESFDLYAETFTYVLVSTGPNEIAVTAAMTAKEVAD